MEVLACIPELPCPATFMAQAAASEPPLPAKVASVPGSTPEPPVPAVDAEAAEAVSPALRRGAAGRSRPTRFSSPSIILLVAVAAALWAAAWRNDRLRLEASRQQRPERIALELPVTAGAARSVTP
jgi:hypothetical protein